jgi:DNA-binding response OmpR family regulator
MNPPRILLIDDDTELVRSLRLVLTQEGYEVTSAYNGLEGLQTAHQTQPDLIVLDVNMPWMDGLEVCRRLRLEADATLRTVPILMLTSLDSVDDHVTGLDAGADDYLNKPFQSKELKARVRALLRRSQVTDRPTAINKQELRVGPVTLHVQAYWAQREGGDMVQLTPAEFELLYYLMTHPKRPFSSQDLLEEVWGYAPGTADPSLVRFHIKNLRQKLEADPAQPSLIRTASRLGYMFVPD